MAPVFPLSLPAVGYDLCDFALQRQVVGARLRSGAAQRIERGASYWHVTLRTVRLNRAQWGRVVAFNEALDFGLNGCLVHDVNQPFPQQYPNGFAALTRASDGSAFNGRATVTALDGSKVSLSGLPAGFALKRGDWLGLVEDGRYSLHRIQEDRTATSSGTIIGLHLSPGPDTGYFSTAAGANFDRPKALMLIDPEVMDAPWTGPGSGPVVITAAQSFRRYWAPDSLFAAGAVGAYYDPAVLSSLWEDTAGTTPANIGSRIARIDDLSGNGNHATQATTANRPTLLQDSSGNFFLNFDGSNDSLALPTAPLTAGAHEVMACSRLVTTGVGGAIYSQRQAASATPRLGHLEYTTTDTPRARATDDAATAITVTDGTARLTTNIVAALRWDETELGIRVNEETETTSAGTLGTTTTDLAEIGISRTGGIPFPGRIYALTVINKELTTAQRDELRAWTAGKGGVTL